MVDPIDIDRARASQVPGFAPDGEKGVVTQVSPQLLVNSTGTDEAAVALHSYAPALTDIAVLMRLNGVTVLLGRIGTGGTPPTPPKTVQSGSTPFAPVYTFSWRDGSDFEYKSDVRQGAIDTSGAWAGAWFYQRGPGATLAGAAVTGCAVKLTRASGGTPGPQAAHLTRSSVGTWPVADLQTPPTPVGDVIDCVLAPGESGWFDLPIALGQALVDGDAGLMISGSDPMVLLTGVDTDPESGLLRIDWNR